MFVTKKDHHFVVLDGRSIALEKLAPNVRMTGNGTNVFGTYLQKFNKFGVKSPKMLRTAFLHLLQFDLH